MLGENSALSYGDKQGLMGDLVRLAQGDFIVGTIDVGSSSLQVAGDAIATVGYASSTTDLGAAAGVSLIAIGNAMKYTGLGIETILDYNRGNYQKIGYNVFSNGAMYGIGRLGKLAPGTNEAIFNLMLIPYNGALNYGASTIHQKQKK